MATAFDSTMNDTKVTSCPWGKKPEEKPVCSFASVMDEEFAKQLQKEEDNYTDIQTPTTENDVSEVAPSDETSNDLLLAQMLQLEFNKENDSYIRSLEKTYNGTSKVSMSFKNYKATHPYHEEDVTKSSEYADEDEDEDDSDAEDTEEIEQRKAGGEIVTKHDSFACERKNARHVEHFPLHFNSGDVGRKDIRLPNHVYNKLKTHSKKEERAGMRIHEKKEHSTHEKALDENTRLILYKMVNNGTLDSISGIVSTGKEAVVMHAKGGQSTDGPLPSEIAIKVFKTTLNEFKTREKYIKDDHRFRDRFAKQNPRKVVRLWAEKEFRNLKRMKEVKLDCSEVVLIRKHVLLMKFIGKDQVPAPKLKDAILSRAELEQAHVQCIQTMKIMYNDCNLIHSDLSEYNILWHNGRCVFIDVSQAVEPVHPHAFHFLLRDCRNIVSFFKRAGLDEDLVMTEEQLFGFVCGKELSLSNLDTIEKELKADFEKCEESLTYGIDSENYAFDYHFSRTQLENAELQDSSDDDIDY